MEEEKKMDEFKALLEDTLKKEYDRGMEVGVRTICTHILNILNNSSMPLIQRVNAVKKFCNTPMKGKSNEQNNLN